MDVFRSWNTFCSSFFTYWLNEISPLQFNVVEATSPEVKTTRELSRVISTDL